MATRTFNVSTAAELTAALAKAVGGDHVVLAAGNYGDVTLSKLTFASNVTLSSADATHPAVFNSISLSRVSNLTLDDVSVKFTPTDKTQDANAGIDIRNCSGITVSNSHIEGGASPLDGLLVGRGISALWSTNVTFSDNEVTAFRRGIFAGNVDGLNVLDNNVHHNRTSTLSGGNVSNVLVEGNELSSSHPNDFGGTGDHGDYIHFWTTTGQVGASSNIVIRGNFLAQGDGTALLGIYLDDNTNNKGFKNVLIEDNLIHNGNAQGLRMEDVDGLVVRNNTLLQSSGEARDAPGILLADGTKNAIIDNNILGGVTGPAMKDLRGNNIAIVDNFVVQNQDSHALNYIGNLFTNPFAKLAGIADLRAIPGSIAESYGAAMTHIVPTAEAFDGIIDESHGTGLALSTHHFNVLDADNPNDNALPKGATVVWNFGDGTQAKGANLLHTYGAGGDYVATATVTLSTGAKYVIEKNIHVSTPVAITATFETGLKDLSDLPNLVSNTGSYHFVASEFGKSVHLDAAKAAVKFQATDEILDNKDFTISLAFKKDVGAETAGGRVLYFSGTAVIDVGANSITLRGSSSDGEAIVLKSSGSIGIQDSNWHQITYTASQTDGHAILYVDGKEVARMDGLTGGQHTTSGHSLYLGNPFGPNMSGLLDNVSFLQAALTPEQVHTSYTSFQHREIADFSPVTETQTVLTAIGMVSIDASLTDASLTDASATDTSGAVAQTTDSFHASDWNGYTFDANHLPAGWMHGAELAMGNHGRAMRFDGQGGYVDLGRIKPMENATHLGFSVDFARSVPDQDVARLVWNHQKLGLSLSGDGLIIQAATADEGFKSFTVSNLGLDDTDLHRINVMLDTETDRLQVVVDDKLVLDEKNTDFDIIGAGGREAGWTLGTGWNRYFDGDVVDFRLGDRFEFLGDTAHVAPGTSV